MQTNQRSPRDVRPHRTHKRVAGQRSLQIWVPDTRSRAFAARIRRQCLALKDDRAEADAARFGEAAARLVKGWE